MPYTSINTFDPSTGSEKVKLSQAQPLSKAGLFGFQLFYSFVINSSQYINNIHIHSNFLILF